MNLCKTALVFFAIFNLTARAESLSSLIDTRDISISHQKTTVSPEAQKQVRELSLKGESDVIDFSTDITHGPRIEVQRRGGQVTRISEASSIKWDTFTANNKTQPTETTSSTSQFDSNGRLLSHSKCSSRVYAFSEPASLVCFTLTEDLCSRLNTTPELTKMDRLQNKIDECQNLFKAVNEAWSKIASDLKTDENYQTLAKADAKALKPMLDRTIKRTKLWGLLSPNWDSDNASQSLSKLQGQALQGEQALFMLRDTMTSCRKLNRLFATTRNEREGKANRTDTSK